ncbi:hypothetical protein [Dietzia maris]|uniref:hypothetical protein n=1 Tax=Dietzia maris TaxID=37915 RepID=UPI003556C7A5
MLHPALGEFIVSAVSTAGAGPLVRKWLRRRQSFDLPNERSSHTVPTPRGGGLACAAGGVVGAAASRMSGSGATTNWLGASATLGAIGRVDDLASLPSVWRLGAQVLTGIVAGARVGGPIGATAGAVALPSIVNAFNFMDGINGISGGTAAAWGLVVATDPSLQRSSRAQGGITAGMGLGFLPYNVPRASMFLGDVGSYLLGSGIAITVLESSFTDGRLNARNAGRALAPLAPYLSDTGTTIMRRAFRGDSVTEAHREHAYQRLVHESGWSHWAVSGLVTIATAACGLSGRSRYGVVAVTSIVALYVLSPLLARYTNPQVDESVRAVPGGRL